MAKIFISYRREDSQHQADRLHAALSRKMPKKNIFIDVDNIPVGVDFVKHLDQQVGECDVLLALIGPDWLEAKNPQNGNRRLDDPKDFVRIEIASALKRGIPVAPVLLDGAAFPPEHRLPEDLRALTRRNGVEVRRLTFDADAERLIRGLNLTRASAAKPQPRHASTHGQSSPTPSAGAPRWMGPAVGISLLAVGGSTYAWFGNPGDWRRLKATASETAAPAEPYLSALVDTGKGGIDPGQSPVAPMQSGGLSPPLTEFSTPPVPIATPAADSAARAVVVKRLQAALSTLGFYSGGADGAVGSGTRSAAQSFASAQGIAAPDLAAGPLADAEAFATRAEQAALVWATQEAAAWRLAKDATTRAPLDAYLREFPNGPNVTAARSRITALTPPAATATTPAPTVATASALRAGESFRDCSGCPQMVSIPSGNFLMGSPASETGRFNDEGPQRRVSVPAFAAGKYEVTWTEYEACVAAGACEAAEDDGFGKGSRPVTGVSWDDAKRYAAWLSSRVGKTYRLLTEAEWEYSARAGSQTRWGFGDSESSLGYHAWYASNSNSATHPVGRKAASAFGLYDMHGNVWEWVEDCYANSYSAGQPSDGSSSTQGRCSVRVGRGGSWINDPQGLRSAFRSWNTTTARNNLLGFRVARTL